MSKFKVTQKVRLKGTLINCTIQEAFDDSENSKYIVLIDEHFMEYREEELSLLLAETMAAKFENMRLAFDSLKSTIKEALVAVKSWYFYTCGIKTRLLLTLIGGFLLAHLLRIIF